MSLDFESLEPRDQQRAEILVDAAGFSYEEALVAVSGVCSSCTNRAMPRRNARGARTTDRRHFNHRGGRGYGELTSAENDAAIWNADPAPLSEEQLERNRAGIIEVRKQYRRAMSNIQGKSDSSVPVEDGGATIVPSVAYEERELPFEYYELPSTT